MIITGKVERVIDGDSVLVRTSSINIEDVRLKDVHAPEIGQEGHDEAKEYLERLLPVGISVEVDVQVDTNNKPVKTAGLSRNVVYSSGSKKGEHPERIVGTIYKNKMNINQQVRDAQNRGIIRRGGY